MQFEAGLLLQVADDAEEIACLRIAARAEHADKAFRRRAGRRAELLKTDRRFDVVAQDRLAGIDIAGSMVSMPSRSSASAKAGSRATRFCTSSLKSRVTAMARLLIIVPAACAAACSPPTILSPFRCRVAGAAWCHP